MDRGGTVGGGYIWLWLQYLALFSVAAKMGQKYTNPSQCVFDFEPESVFEFCLGCFFPEILNLRLITGFVLIFVAVVISKQNYHF